MLKRETARPPAPSRAAQERRFHRFLAEYNHDRPHAALGGAVPAALYQPSQRPLPRRLPPVDYPADYEVRRVASSGRIRWHRRRLFLSEVLAGEDIGFQPVADGVWLVRFAAMPLALFDERRWRLRDPATEHVLPMSSD